MKKALEAVLIRWAKNDFFWKILKPISTIGVILNNARLVYEAKKVENRVQYLGPINSSVVLNGPFKGIKYPRIESVGSKIYPKLLGSYESELHSTINEFLIKDYSEILDIGCAEGYYAVGMAVRSTCPKIFAYDTDEKAREICAEMAELNRVSEKIFIGSHFTSEYLRAFKFSGKALIICDCEGFEKTLFNESNVSNLKYSNIIIETHDFIDIEISTSLKKLFRKTHDVESIFSIDDIQKALTSDHCELAQLSLKEKREILAEGRPAIMEWLVCRSKM